MDVGQILHGYTQEFYQRYLVNDRGPVDFMVFGLFKENVLILKENMLKFILV